MMGEIILQKDVTDAVSNRIKGLEQDGLQLPANYNASNALKSAWFAIQKVQDRNKRPALEVVTKESVANTLLDMVVQGLSPAKTQCYFVVYGKELQMQRSYFGTQAVLKRLSNVKDIWAEVVHKGDVFRIGSEKGRTVVKEFEPDFANQDNEIIGAFAVIEKNDGERVYTVMTKKEIDKSWSKAKTKNVQNDFPGEMAKRTVINRAAKTFINTSDDSDLLTDAINRTTEYEYDENRRKEAEPVADTAIALEEKLFANNKKVSEQENDIEQAKPIEKEDLTKTAEQILEEPVQETLDVMAGYETNQKEREADVSTIEEDDYPF
ncbi:RecT protein [Enterococcus faecalis]|nr:RecT protein [Enterococcus faecalis]